IPPVAFVPFFVVWFGLFFPARVALVVLMTVFDVLLVITAGARDVRPGLLEAGRSFAASGFARATLIVLPALTPFLFAGLRVVFLLIWELAGERLGEAVLAPPSAVAADYIELLRQDDMLRELLFSLRQMAVGYAAACIVGMPLGVAMGRSRVVDAIFHPWVAM